MLFKIGRGLLILLFLEHVIDGACTYDIIKLIIKAFITCTTLNKEDMAKRLLSFVGWCVSKHPHRCDGCKFKKEVCIPLTWVALRGPLHKFDDVNLELFIFYFKARRSTPTTICIFFPSPYSSPQI
jgi:hypothetical protein